LLIEDAPEFQLLVRSTLRGEFEIVCAVDAEQALAAVAARSFDLILIDVGLPGRDGLSLCEELRRDPRLKNTPILFVTGRNETSDLVQGFAVGADDYIFKPFHPDELRARIKARLARNAASFQGAAVDDFWRGRLHFQVGRQRVSFVEVGGEKNLFLTPNEFKILYLLVKNDPRTLVRAEILREIWGENLNVVERTVDKHICSLRRKLGVAAGYVVSIPGQGYAFQVQTEKTSVFAGASNT
jgi:DNA-binding response OmpR family regulator